MSTYEIDQLREMWRLDRITEEQAIGQMILHAQKIAQIVVRSAWAVSRE